MQIGELAARLGTTPRALRHYEQQGLLGPARAGNGYRLYDEDAVVRAENVKALLDVGLTTEDIREHAEAGCLDLPADQTPPCRAELGPIQARLERLDALIARLETVRDRLRVHAGSVRSSLDGPGRH